MGEASAPEAVVKVEITGTPQSVQRAVSKMARKIGKKISLKDESPLDKAQAKEATKSDKDEAPDSASDVVEALIKEDTRKAKPGIPDYARRPVNTEFYKIYDAKTGELLLTDATLDASEVEAVSSDTPEGHFKASEVDGLEQLGDQTVYAVVSGPTV